MTDYEHIFFDPGPRTSALEAATELAGALHMNVYDNDIGLIVVRTGSDGGSVLGGRVTPNLFSDVDPDRPEEFSVFDAMPLVWSVTRRPARDRDAPRTAALGLFHELVQSDLGWPMVLVTGFDWLVAAYDTGRGLRVFPEHTSPDEDGVEVWR